MWGFHNIHVAEERNQSQVKSSKHSLIHHSIMEVQLPRTPLQTFDIELLC